MNAITKNRQQPETIQHMIKMAFGDKRYALFSDILEMDGGFCNAVYAITLDNGREVILKIAPTSQTVMMSYEKGMLATEVEVLKLVRYNTKVPVPEVLYYDPSCSVCNAPYFFMENLHGVMYHTIKNQCSEEENYAIQKQIGEYNRQINEITGTKFGLSAIPETQSDNLTDFVRTLFRMTINDGIKAGSNLVHISYDELWKLILLKSHVLAEVQTPRLVHWDLWDGNVFIQNTIVSGIIDFERAFYGDVLMEHEFSGFSVVSSGYAEGYGKHTYTKSELIRRSLYRLYRYLTMIIECDYRCYDDNSQYEWVTGLLKEELILLRSL